MTSLLKFEITVYYYGFHCQFIQGHWRGLIIRNESVWPTLFLLNVSAALKGTHNYILLNEFKELSVTAKRNLRELKPEDIRVGRVKRSYGLLPFVGDLSRTLFNTVTMDDFERIAGKVNQIIARGNKFGDALVQPEKNFQSYMTTNDHRVDELSGLIWTTMISWMRFKMRLHELLRNLKKLQKPSLAW